MARLYFSPLNPVAMREMKARMRGPRTFALLGIYLLLLALVIFVVYLRKGAAGTYSYGGTMLSGNFGPTRNFETGQDMFIAIFLYLLVVMAIVTPTICGGLISREMEDQTYDMLVVTPLRGRTLIYGKLVATLGYLTLLILLAFPVASIVFIFGGVTLEQILVGFAIVLMETFVIGIISLFFSALFRRTSLATIATYSIVLLLLIGVPIASSSIVSAINSDANRTGQRTDARLDGTFDFPKRMLVFNPFAALGSVLAPNAPYRPGRDEDLQYFPNSRLFWGNPTQYYATPTFPPGSVLEQFTRLSKLPVLPNQVQFWQGYLLVYTGLGLFFLILSFGVVKPLPRRPGFNPLRRPTKWAINSIRTRREKQKKTVPNEPEDITEALQAHAEMVAGEDSAAEATEGSENPGPVSGEAPATVPNPPLENPGQI
jgi:ABC-type transport system involved in multi-copper enzyme maturation permease subunit